MNISNDLAERCQEILDWRNTGKLKTGGRVRALADSIDGDVGTCLRVAESKTAEEAMKFVVKVHRRYPWILDSNQISI